MTATQDRKRLTSNESKPRLRHEHGKLRSLESSIAVLAGNTIGPFSCGERLTRHARFDELAVLPSVSMLPRTGHRSSAWMQTIIIQPIYLGKTSNQAPDSKLALSGAGRVA